MEDPNIRDLVDILKQTKASQGDDSEIQGSTQEEPKEPQEEPGVHGRLYALVAINKKDPSHFYGLFEFIDGKYLRVGWGFLEPQLLGEFLVEKFDEFSAKNGDFGLIEGEEFMLHFLGKTSCK